MIFSEISSKKYFKHPLFDIEISLDDKIRSLNSKKIKRQLLTNGYIKIFFYQKRQLKIEFLHVLKAQIFIENKNNFPFVNHKNKKFMDNAIDNLEWSNFSEYLKLNSILDLLSYRMKKTTKMRKANKLDREKVKYIRDNCDKYTNRELAKKFNVSIITINMVLNNKIWKDCPLTTKKRKSIGRNIKGYKYSNAKLKNEDVEFIRENKNNLKGVELAKMFNIDPSTICRIKNNINWTEE